MQMTEAPTESAVPSTESPMGMNDADTKCAASRYPTMFAGSTTPAAIRDTYSDLKSWNGILGTCANNLTDYQAQHLLWNSPDLQQKYGKGQAAYPDARKYYTDKGYAEGLEP